MPSFIALGQSNPTTNGPSNTDPEAFEEKLVKGVIEIFLSVIEIFLSVIGNYDLDSLETFFAGHANISGSSLRDNIWKICVPAAGD